MKWGDLMALTAIRIPESDYLNECFYYEQKTGELFWKHRPLKHFSSSSIQKQLNTRFAGKPAGAFIKTKTGAYRIVRLDGVIYYAHRLIFKMVNGVEPEVVDHIDGNTTNNRIENLRSCTNQDNSKNARLSKTNTSGHTGVSWSHHKKKWWANIVINAKQIYLGSFTVFNKAVEARRNAEIKYGFHDNHGKNRTRFTGETGNER
mgnify:FL=1